MNTNEANIGYCAALVLAGIAFHFLTKLGELEKQGTIITPWEYWRKHPYTSAGVILAAYLVMILQLVIGELTYSAALLTGIAANSMGDKLRASGDAVASRKLDKVDPP